MTEVNKALLAVCKIFRSGNKVVFGDDEGSYIEDKRTGERIWMKEEGGMYLLKMWVKQVYRGEARANREACKTDDD